MADTSLESSLSADEVAAYLRHHPQFLADHPDLALALRIPREHGEVASLASWQLQALRERERELEARLLELIDNAQRNEVLMLQVHGITLRLMAAPDLAQGLDEAVRMMAEGLRVDQVRIVLFLDTPDLATADWLQLEPRGPAALPLFGELLAAGEPQCGRLNDAQAQYLFADEGAAPASAALVPLGSAGLLALGSDDANHFHPGMGTTFLDLLAAALGTAIARLPIDPP